MATTNTIENGSTSTTPTYAHAPPPRAAGVDTLSPTPSRAPSYVEREEAPPEVDWRRSRALGKNPAPSVLNFSRDEYKHQRKVYATSYLLGFCVGAPEAGLQIVKSVEKGVARLTGSPLDRKAERRRLRLIQEESEEAERLQAREEVRRRERAEESSPEREAGGSAGIRG